MEESAEDFCDIFWFQVGANSKIFPGETISPIRKEQVERNDDEDIKTAALEALVPCELKQNLAMNRARLMTYEQVRSEIQAYNEARRSQFAFKTVAAKCTSDPMDVDSFCKGCKKGKKGKGDGKNVKKEGQTQSENPNPSKDIVSLSTECWSNPKNQSGSGGLQN